MISKIDGNKGNVIQFYQVFCSLELQINQVIYISSIGKALE